MRGRESSRRDAEEEEPKNSAFNFGGLPAADIVLARVGHDGLVGTLRLPQVGGDGLVVLDGAFEDNLVVASLLVTVIGLIAPESWNEEIGQRAGITDSRQTRTAVNRRCWTPLLPSTGSSRPVRSMPDTPLGSTLHRVDIF